jgi:hypothetical protein
LSQVFHPGSGHLPFLPGVWRTARPVTASHNK